MPEYTVETVNDSGTPRVNVVSACPFCEKPSRVCGIPTEGFLAWQGGRHIQYALPELTPGQAETLISGAHEECFDAALRAFDGPDDEFDEDDVLNELPGFREFLGGLGDEPE